MCGPNVLEVEGPVIIMEQVPMVGVGLVGSIMLKTSVALNLCEKCARHNVRDPFLTCLLIPSANHDGHVLQLP
jgi:hypothetical protein